MRAHQLVLQSDVLLGRPLLLLERRLLTLGDSQPTQLVYTLFLQRFKLRCGFIDRFLELSRTDDVLKVLEQAVFMLCGRFGFHLCDGLDFTLQTVQLSTTTTFQARTCKMRKRLWSRSIPRSFKRVCTSL